MTVTRMLQQVVLFSAQTTQTAEVCNASAGRNHHTAW